MWQSIEEYAGTIVTTPQSVRALISLYSNGFPCVWVGVDLSAMHVAALRAELEEAHGTDTTRYDVERAGNVTFLRLLAPESFPHGPPLSSGAEP
jgi:hypothetical protein